MTVLDEVDARIIMRTRLKTVASLPDPDTLIAWEHRTFRPPSLTKGTGTRPLFVSEQMRILTERHAAVGMLEVVGETLFMINTPAGKGTNGADILSKAIMEAFEPTQGLNSATQTVVIERSERRPYRANPVHEGWIFKTVAIRWRAYTLTT